jgi:chromosome segregation ATPase
MTDIVNQLLSRKVIENSKLKDENEDLKRQLDDCQLVISALSGSAVDETKLNETQVELKVANDEKRELQKEKDRLKNLLNKSNDELKDAQHRMSKLHSELTRLKSEVKDKHITKQDHQKAMKVLQDYIKSLQVEIDLFRQEFNNVTDFDTSVTLN